MSRQIINNFLSREDFLTVKNSILNEQFPWTFFDKSYPNGSCEERFNCQFVHIFYQSPTYTSKYLDVINPILKKLSHQVFIRAKANLTMAAEKIQIYGHHIDLPESISKISKTAIFYLNTNDGFTEFENGDRVESIENRIVIFDSNELHSGTNCTNQKYRAVINFNFIT